MSRYFLLLLLLVSAVLRAEQSVNSLMEALEVAAYWDYKLEERFPLTYNHLLSTGYFVTPSARMSEDGEFGGGVAYAPPYLNINGRIQPFPFLELTANYRIFRGVEDPGLSPHGFGDYADRGANFKFGLLWPEVFDYCFPGIAFGMDDFMGSCKFTTYYIVGTQVWKRFGLEMSLGWGRGRYADGPSKGVFGGINWLPFYHRNYKWTKGISLAAEFDPTKYEDPEIEPHPKGRSTKSPVNFGLKYNLCDLIEVSASYIRGEEFAVSGSLHCNLGKTEGFLPKLDDPLPYRAPVDRQPLGCYRPESVMIQNLNYALLDQGFQLISAWMEESCLGPRLTISLINRCYRHEHVYRERLQCLLASLTPSNIEEVVVIIESYGLPCQKYVYPRELLLEYVAHTIFPHEFHLVTPRQEATLCCNETRHQIFHRRYELWRCHISPRFETFFGSAAGKFKYDLGIKANFEGFLPYQWYYEVEPSFTVLSDIHHLADFDFYHPSQILNVASDYIRYRQQSSFTWDRLYLQKSWNFGRSCFGRISGGYFQVNYGGIAGEALFYPANANFAVGLEGAVVKKRNYSGLGFQSTLRKFEGGKPVWVSYSTLQQYFLSFYLDYAPLQIFTKLSVGQFLARDKGVRLEATRYFDNGFRITGWITYTDAGDKIHGENYYDRGVAIEIPFDFFYKRSCKRVWSYGMAAWLRDAGYSTTTGIPLFDTLNQERRW
ncbi:MAG: hypothetical protein K940chlam9_01261 [Chlamydiae bacterium]|nr:hypothetical protein [Chlamydiota bacterium]